MQAMCQAPQVLSASICSAREQSAQRAHYNHVCEQRTPDATIRGDEHASVLGALHHPGCCPSSRESVQTWHYHAVLWQSGSQRLAEDGRTLPRHHWGVQDERDVSLFWLVKGSDHEEVSRRPKIA